MSTDSVSPEFLASIQPIVLVGGRSRRFGRDKLREPWGGHGRVLVQHPIASLRAVFGPRVMIVGKCHRAISLLADGVIPDVHPGVGPMGGIVSALQVWGGPVFVLAGDMPSFPSEDILTILRVAERIRPPPPSGPSQIDCIPAPAFTRLRPHPCSRLASFPGTPVCCRRFL